MSSEKTVPLQVKIDFTDGSEAPQLQAYVFTSQGKLLGSAPVEKDSVEVQVPAELDGRTIEVILGPRVERGQPEPTAASLKRMGAYVKPARFLIDERAIEVRLPGILFPTWCLCLVRGRLIKRITLPDGTTVERPVCNARVHICEVDQIPFVIYKLSDAEILRLRDDLLYKLRVFPEPIPPIPPGPDPRQQAGQVRALAGGDAAPGPALSAVHQHAVSALAASSSVSQLRSRLIDLSSLIVIHLCDLIYLWPYFSVDCLTTVYADGEGRFHTVIGYNCADQPDLYFWVEQFQEGVWHTVYRPSIGCGTHWNYACGTEVVINLPGAVACETPTYDIPPGVTLFVLPHSIASSRIWGIPPGAPPAPDGWVRPDGFINYVGGSLGWIYNAPFGGTLNFIQDDSYYIPSSGIKYYRYSYRRVGSSDWNPVSTPLARGYRMEYSDRLPTYEAYPVGPVTVGTQSNLFEFKPRTPPARPADPATVVVREWTSGNLSEVAASWNTLAAAPPLSDENTTDDAGDFEVKIEVFDPAGTQVLPGPATFQFLVLEAGGTTTRLATPAELAAGAYVLRVHVDNNNVEADLPQPSIGGVAASDDCGFLRYEAMDRVLVQYLAAHPNDRAVFRFEVKRGSNRLSSASTADPYVEVSAAAAGPYTKVSGSYQHPFPPEDLVGTCVNAAFAARLNVYGKAFNGHDRLGLDAERLIAFALAELETAPDE